MDAAAPRRARSTWPRAGCAASPALPLAAAARAAGAARRPAQALEATREALEALGEVVLGGARTPAPETPLNVEIGPHRRLAFVRGDLEDFKLVKNAFGGTVNDVVLAVVAGRAAEVAALARRAHGGARAARARARSRSARAASTTSSATGSPPCAGRCPSTSQDPVARLRVVSQAMEGLKDSKQALGAEVLASLEALAPPTILAQASRLNFSTRLFNLLVTNVPGPQFPLYVLGRRLEDLFPVAFLPKRHALAVAIMSYNGRMDFGLLGDYDAMPDLDRPRRAWSRRAWRSWWRRRARRAGTGGRSVAERELRVLGHLLGRPRGREHHRRRHGLDAGQLADELLHLLRRPAGRSGRPAW